MAKAKTPTPSLYVDTIVPGCNNISGWVGSIVIDPVVLPAKYITPSPIYLPNGVVIPAGRYLTVPLELPTGTQIPEPNAYIYIYIDGLLINPPILNPDGSYGYGAVLATTSGYWSTSNFFVDLITPFNVGQVLTVRAKSRGKSVSDRGTPYRIGGTPTPIDLGVRDAFGRVRPPHEGETSLAGRVSYWTVAHNGPTRPGLLPGDPIFGCNTDIFIYLDGVNVGKVQKNSILGNNAVYPAFEDLSQFTFQLMIGSTPTVIPIAIQYPSDIIPLDYFTEGSPDIYQFTLPGANTYPRIFRNGLRQQEGVDFTLTISSDFVVTIIYSYPIEPTDRLIAIVQYQSNLLVFGEALGPLDGIEVDFPVSQTMKPGTEMVYYNGGRIYAGVDYTIPDLNTIHMLYAPEAADHLVIDYQPDVNQAQVIYQQQLIGAVDGVNREFTFTSLAKGSLHVYRNLLLQAKGTDRDYLLDEENNTVTFNPWAIPQTGEFLFADIVVSAIGTQELADYLNTTEEFTRNCVTASVIPATDFSSQLKIESPYPLELGPQDTMGPVLFGSGMTLFPGKDDNGEFKHYFNVKTSDWRYTHFEPFLRLQHLTARVISHGNVILGECV